MKKKEEIHAKDLTGAVHIKRRQTATGQPVMDQRYSCDYWNHSQCCQILTRLYQETF